MKRKILKLLSKPSDNLFNLLFHSLNAAIILRFTLKFNKNNPNLSFYLVHDTISFPTIAAEGILCDFRAINYEIFCLKKDGKNLSLVEHFIDHFVEALRIFNPDRADLLSMELKPIKNNFDLILDFRFLIEAHLVD